MSLEICRICGSKENLKHVFREGTDELLDKIRLCANIHIDAVDSLPKFVCNACEHGLDFSYRLRKRGEETEKMLRQELLGPTKREHSTSVEDDEKGDAVNGGIDEANEELWIKEEHNEHFDEESIDHVKEETSPMKQSCDETEDWLTMPDEDISDTDEIIVNGSVGHIKVEPMIDQGESCSSMIEELDQTDSQMSSNKPNYFKVVEMIDGGKSILSIVPGHWERNGKLIMPPQKTKEKTKKNPWALPGSVKEGWSEYNCILKRTFIPTYDQALNEIRGISNRGHTGEVEAIFTPTTMINRCARKFVTLTNNEITQQLGKSLPKPKIIKSHKPQRVETFPRPSTSTLPNLHVKSVRQLVDKEQQLETATDFACMVVSIAESVTKLQTKIEYSISLQEQILSKIESGIPFAGATATNLMNPQPNAAFEPIDTIKQLINFEAKLVNKKFVDELCPKFYSIYGPTNSQIGDNACYKFVDSMFTRRLFTLVSWTGQSRTEQRKENFSRFILTFKFFFHLIRRCDPQYTESNLKDFFQRIISNSRRRYERTDSGNIKPKRASTVKRHSKKRCENKPFTKTPNLADDGHVRVYGQCSSAAKDAIGSSNESANDCHSIDYNNNTSSGEDDDVLLCD